MTHHMPPTSVISQRGVMLPIAMTICTLLLAIASWSFGSPTSTLEQSVMLDRTASQISSQALIKGFSRAEETGAPSCPDGNSDGLPDFCGSGVPDVVGGNIARYVKISAGQLQLAPGPASGTWQRPHLEMDASLNSGNDLSLLPASNPSGLAWTIALRSADRGNGDETTLLERSTSKSETSAAVQRRLKSTFIAHLQLSASSQRQALTPAWAFGQNLHLSYQNDSAGTRFTPVNSGCQCSCTRTRCKCACLEPSTWESTGNCVTATDAGTCTQAKDASGSTLFRCTAGPGKYCYLAGPSWLAKRWAISLFTPRATEGRACRPEGNDACPLPPKTGTLCTCAFDWPKPLSPDRLSRLRLQFESGNATAFITF